MCVYPELTNEKEFLQSLILITRAHGSLRSITKGAEESLIEAPQALLKGDVAPTDNGIATLLFVLRTHKGCVNSRSKEAFQLTSFAHAGLSC